MAVGWVLIGPDWRALLSNPPFGKDVLFWTQAQRDAGFRMLDRVPLVVESRSIAAGQAVYELEKGEPLELGPDLDDYWASQRTASLVILHDGKLRVVRYGLDFSPSGRWTSFSVAKSLTSTLVGAAIQDGHIKSLDEPLGNYITELVGSAYEKVTIAQLLTMTSGVAWNVDYEDPQSDVARFDSASCLVSNMAGLPRAHPAGEQWNYSTRETKNRQPMQLLVWQNDCKLDNASINCDCQAACTGANA